jgi:hypothetical protein
LRDFQARWKSPAPWDFSSERLLPPTASPTNSAIEPFQPTLDGYGYEVADCGLLSADLAAGIHRIKGAKRLSAHVENWLIAAQGKRLLLTAGEAGL